LYWVTGQFKQWQRAVRSRFHKAAPSHSVIQEVARKLKTKENLEIQYGEYRPAVTGNMMEEVGLQ
jgi:hypothetical protein